MTKEKIKKLLKDYHGSKTRALWNISQGKNDDESVIYFNAVEKCIEVLPPEMRDIIKHVFIEGWSYRKIAREMYYGKSTIERKIDAGIDLMATCLVDL